MSNLRDDPFLKSKQEADLLSHYINTLSPFLDVAFEDQGQHRHFAHTVSHKARHSKTLLNAILALSARHLSLTRSGYDQFASDGYLQSCLRSFIPALNDADEATADDVFFATAVILRYLEEMDVVHVGSDPQGHRLGTQAIIRVLQTKASNIDGLRKTCYWTAFRQELSISMLTQRPMQWSIPMSIRIDAEPRDDSEWCLLAVQQCEKVIQFAFSEQAVRSVANFTMLKEELERWRLRLPPTFEPLFYLPGNTVMDRDSLQELPCSSVQTTNSTPSNNSLSNSHGTPHGNADEIDDNDGVVTSPQIYFNTPTHTMAHAYNTLGHLLLMIYTPQTEIGLHRRVELFEIDRSIRHDVFTLCGIATTNQHVACAGIMAAVAIALGGDRFCNHGRHRRPSSRAATVRSWSTEQQLLRDVLIHAEQNLGWPTTKISRELEMLWRSE